MHDRIQIPQRTMRSSTMIATLKKHHDAYRDHIEQLQQPQLSMQTLKNAMASGKRTEAIISSMEKRGNILLGMALDVAGLQRYAGKWTLQIDRNPQRILEDAQDGNIRFILQYDHKNRWKGNILHCPLLKIMYMSFRTEWLTMPTKKVQKEMLHLLQGK